MRPAIPLRVNRAPVLALWVAVVAERLGHAPATALSLAAVQAGIAPEPPRDLPHGQPAGRRPAPIAIGQAARLVPQSGAPPLADRGDGVAVPPGPAGAYLRRAFGPRLGEARAAMEALAARQDPGRLESLCLPLFAAFAPVAAEAAGRARLDLDRIARADCGA